MDNNPVDNEIFFNVKDIKLADFKNIEDKYLTRKKNFYKVYFDDQMTNYPKNIIKVTLMGYLGGCFFGVIMLAFSMLGATRFDQSMASIKYEESLYKNMSEFKVAMKQKVWHPIHRNGMFVVKINLTLGLIHAASIYFPFTSKKFSELYGILDCIKPCNDNYI